MVHSTHGICGSGVLVSSLAGGPVTDPQHITGYNSNGKNSLYQARVLDF